MRHAVRASGLLAAFLVGTGVMAARDSTTGSVQADAWVTAWASSAHGPYPSGNAVAQPVLDFAFPSPASGARDQTFRLIIRPDIWGARVRLRFTNAFGTNPLEIDDAFVALPHTGGALVPGTSERVTFDGGRLRVTVPPGAVTWSDPVSLPFVSRADDPLLAGRDLAVSFHIAGETGPMTWHAKALTTSYLTAPGAGSHAADESAAAFPYSTTSWYFLDALDVLAPSGTSVIVCFGDSITDGTGSTINGSDRWPDELSRRLHQAFGNRVVVVNAGIGGNRIVGPAEYSAATPFGGGPSALDRLDRDVLSLSGVKAVVWLEGINDITAGATASAIGDGIREGVRRMRARGLTLVMATLTSAVGSSAAAGTPAGDATRRAVNQFIRTAGLFDAVADFDAVTTDAATGALKPAFQPNSSVGGAGDRIHPNRAGYLAMGEAVDLRVLAPDALAAR